MKSASLFVLFVCTTNLHSADILKELECHDNVVQHGIETLILPGEVNSLFGATNVDHFISNFGSAAHTPIWNSVTYFAGRYCLSLRVPISVDSEKCKLNGATDGAFVQINETIKVDISKSGIAGATDKGQWRLNENEWKWLVKNKGDWSAVKIPILTNAPVKGFDEFVRQMREPIRNRQENFDKPVRQATETLRNQQNRKDQEKTAEELDKTYRAYLQGEIVEARRSLQESISLLERTQFSKMGAAAHGLWLAHSRLHVLEARAGNSELAEANLLKARFWYVRKLEPSGDSTEQAIQTVRSFTAEKCRELVDDFDKQQTEGKGANYARAK